MPLNFEQKSLTELTSMMDHLVQLMLESGSADLWAATDQGIAPASNQLYEPEPPPSL